MLKATNQMGCAVRERDPRDLYTLEPGATEALAEAFGGDSDGGGPALLYFFEGFMDAGEVGEQISEYLLGDADRRLIASFDTDRLVDYRARRPPMVFARDEWISYQPPVLDLYLVHDAVGVPLLLLSGPEPDVEWELFASAVRDLAQRLGVRLAVNFHGIPMGVPHTRPVGLTPHGNRPGLMGDHPRWFQSAQVPGSAAALVELRLVEAGLGALGFAAHVPHYLARDAYPPAAVAVLEAVQAATGLVLPGAELRAAAERTREEVDRQVEEGGGELRSVVTGLEQQYDAFAGAVERGSLLAETADLPSAEELGDAFERFLAEREDPGDGPLS
nr:PAC2 family protein [Phaeacidiphilus oryzae]